MSRLFGRRREAGQTLEGWSRFGHQSCSPEAFARYLHEPSEEAIQRLYEVPEDIAAVVLEKLQAITGSVSLGIQLLLAMEDRTPEHLIAIAGGYIGAWETHGKGERCPMPIRELMQRLTATRGLLEEILRKLELLNDKRPELPRGVLQELEHHYTTRQMAELLIAATKKRP